MEQHAQHPPMDSLRLHPGRFEDPAGDGASGRSLPCGATLTPRELQVVALVSCGYSNKHIARRLFVSDNTVKYHLKNAFGKLGVSCRAQAVAVVRRLGPVVIATPGADPVPAPGRISPPAWQWQTQAERDYPEA